MTLQERIHVFDKLGDYLKNDIFQEKKEDLRLSELTNPWFTEQNIKISINYWSEMLSEEMLYAWLNPYKLKEVIVPKKVLVIMAGNIPLVGFHDFLSVLILGHEVVVKMSKSDNILLKVLIEKLVNISFEMKEKITFIKDLKSRNFDAVIATGSDNSAQHFEYYFKNVKKIIRKNRRSIAILDGNESNIQLKGLADDVFRYFGLGCRNVSKLFLPKAYNLDKLFNVFFSYSNIIDHKKYANNYDYNKAIFLMGKNKLVENGFLLMKEEKSLFSPVAMLYYEYYDDFASVKHFIDEHSDQLQCVISNNEVPFGMAQRPNLWDYADRVDTIDFLKAI